MVTVYSDKYIISLSPQPPYPLPPYSPSLISLTVSVDVKHHVYTALDSRSELTHGNSMILVIS